jgi:hypothetical protein
MNRGLMHPAAKETNLWPRPRINVFAVTVQFSSPGELRARPPDEAQFDTEGFKGVAQEPVEAARNLLVRKEH